MDTLTASPFNLAFDQLVLVKAISTNFYGSGPESVVNIGGVRVMQKPSQMGPISVISKTETEITLSWGSLTGIATGNSAITAYNLYWDNNSGTVSNLVVSGLINQFTVQGTTGGQTYQFQVTASNVYGEGERSQTLSQISSDVPDLISIARTANVGTNIVINWDAPFNNY